MDLQRSKPTSRAGWKLAEARYFLDRMAVFTGETTHFRFHLSAFLSSARSVTFHLQKQRRADPAFALWYEPHQQALQNSRAAAFLHKSRSLEVHEQVVPTSATMVEAQFTVPTVSGCGLGPVNARLNGDAVTLVPWVGPVPYRAHPERPGQLYRRYRWSFDTAPGSHVLDWCEQYWLVLKDIVESEARTFNAQS